MCQPSSSRLQTWALTGNWYINEYKHETAAEHHAAKRHWLNSHEAGYHKAMGNRQVQMIAIGGAIGTGLFLGAGARLQMAGPALALVYLVCGIFSFFILRALGELVLHRPQRQLRLLRPGIPR
jgi:L-asparagine permease